MRLKIDSKFMKQGNSIYVALPQHVVHLLRLEHKQEVVLDIAKEGLISVRYSPKENKNG